MAETTKIAWTRSTFNPWWGCQAVSPGCSACYAEAWAKRTGRDFNKRTRTSEAYWRQPLKWNKWARLEQRSGKVLDSSGWTKPGFWPVFPSLCDPFDNEVPDGWRDDFWKLITLTPNLVWLLLTKRIGNAAKMLPTSPGGRPYWPHVWIGASVVNQEEADRDIPKLLATPAAKRFVSYEPALGPVDWEKWIWLRLGIPHQSGEIIGHRRIDQIIVGGESTQGGKPARPFNIQWARDTVRQCREAGVAVFVKQLGSNPVSYGSQPCPGNTERHTLKVKDRAGADPAEWPEDLRVQCWPELL